MNPQDTLPPPDNATARVLRALSAVGPIQDQGLSVVSIMPIKTSFGDRWPDKRDQVWRQVEQFLHRQFRAEDFVLRLDEVSVLVVQPGRSPVTAQTLAVRAAADLTRFFLGEAPFTDVLVHKVDAIEGDAVSCSPIPRAQYTAALMARDSAVWAAAAAWRMPILTRMDRDLAAEVSLAPLLALQSGRAGLGFVVRTMISDAVTGLPITREERAALQSSDLAGVDLDVLTTALARQRELKSSAPSLIVPISYHTLGHTSARYTLLQAVHKLSPAERQNLICEIVDLETGTPEGRIAEVVAIARPHCRGVICRLEPSLEIARKLKNAGATLSIAQSRRPFTEQALLKFEPVLHAVLKIIPAGMIHDLAPELLPVATSVGLTHGTVLARTELSGGTAKADQAFVWV